MFFKARKETTQPNLRLTPFEDEVKSICRPINHLAILSVLLFAITLLYSPVARASSQTADDYIRADFTVEDGLPNNIVNALVQTRNGLLWVGTESGLASFDGREFTPIDLHIPGLPAQGAVNALIEGSSGDLWVATNAGVVLIPSKLLDQFAPARMTYYQLGVRGTDEVESLYQARNGVLWAGTNHGLYRMESGRFVLVLAATSVARIAEALNGHLLLITNPGFIEWDGRKSITYPGLAASLGVHPDQIFNVFQDRSGTMWYCTAAGVIRRGPHSFPRIQPELVAHQPAFRTYEDPQGNIWVATKAGIYRALADRLEAPAPNLHARSFYVDRDGELWIGTNGYGLVRLKHRLVHMYTRADGLPHDIAMAVLSSHDGRLWVGENCGLSVRIGNRFKTYAERDGLANTCVWALAQDKNLDIWVGTWGGGLFRCRDGRFVQFSRKQGLVSDVVLKIAVARDNSLWIATPDGISHMQNGRFRNYTIADGLSSNQVFDVYQDRSGSIWAATQGGIDHLVGDTFVPLPGTPLAYRPLSIQFAADSLGHLYTMDSPKGISLIENDRLTTVNEDLRVWNMVESLTGDLWFSGLDGIGRVGVSDLTRSITDGDAPLDYARFDRADGLSSLQCSVGNPSIAITPDQKLWVATVKGLAMIDLSELPRTSRKPEIFVGMVTIGKNKALAGRQLIMPPGVHHVELHLEAVDLASPEKIRLQYRMEGVDANWLDADASRTAIYTTIPPGTHAFHVRATSSDGVWDRIGIVYNVTQRPYFYQTTWFLFVGLSAIVVLLSAAYLIRVRQIILQTHIRVEARLVERERIARELHDTLLQGFYGLLLRLQTGVRLVSATDPAKAILNDALERADRVLLEGRESVRNLRAVSLDRPPLAVELDRVGEDLKFGTSISSCVVTISGDPNRMLNPVAQSEIFAIGREAIVNAFRHSNASEIITELHFDPKRFQLLCRDDGRGITSKDSEPDEGGDHFGLLGMRERAQKLNGELTILPAEPHGTIVALSVSARVAYSKRLWKMPAFVRSIRQRSVSRCKDL